MKFENLLQKVGDLAYIDSENLIPGERTPAAIKVQLSRWVKAGKLIQPKKGIYLLAPLFRKIPIYEPALACILSYPSYVSLEKALEYHGLIPESVPTFTCVTTKRPRRFVSSVGTFDYRHIKTSLFWGYESVTVGQQTAFIASIEKALLDFLYFRRERISLELIEELRLQNVEKINMKKLWDDGARFKKPKLLRAVRLLETYIRVSGEGEKQL